MKRAIGARDAAIFADLVKFRALTNEFIWKRHASHLKYNAVVKITGRLVRQQWLVKYPLFERYVYFLAGTKLLKLHGGKPSQSEPLGPQALAMSIALLNLCSQQLQINLVDPTCWPTELAWLPKKMRGVRVLVSKDPEFGELLLARTDLGGSAEHVAKKCSQDIARRMQLPAFNVAVKQQQVRFVVLTVNEIKAERIRHQINKRDWPIGLRFRIHLVPELIHFIGQ
ncbi:MAG: hypothetical protein AAGG44_08600 [Planctomycetota bacterium]